MREATKLHWPFVRNRSIAQSRGLIAWWPGACPGAAVNIDAAGDNGNHMSFISFANPFTTASGWTAGKDGGRSAIIFDGVNDLCQLSTSLSSRFFYFGAATPWTISCWINVLAQPSNTHGFIAGCRIIGLGNGYATYWEKATSTVLVFYEGINNLYQQRNSSALSLNTWYHVAFTRDSSNTTGGMLIYINGVADAGTTSGNGTPNDFSPISSPVFCMGNDANNNTYPNNCIMEDLRVYNRALSAAEVASMYKIDTRWALRWRPTRIATRINQSTGGPWPHFGRRARGLSGGMITMG